jgi:hypothetical protein
MSIPQIAKRLGAFDPAVTQAAPHSLSTLFFGSLYNREQAEPLPGQIERPHAWTSIP